MTDFYHIVKNRHVFDDKWCDIAKALSIPFLIPQGVHSAIMSFAGMNFGKINEGIFRYILFGYGLVDRTEEVIEAFIKFKVIDKKFNVVNWSKHQKSVLHGKVEADKAVEGNSKLVEWKLSLVEDGVEYLVDKKVDEKLYYAWYNKIKRRGLSCKATYDALTEAGYKIETRKVCQPNNEVEASVEAVEKKLKKVEPTQPYENDNDNFIKNLSSNEDNQKSGENDFLKNDLPLSATPVASETQSQKISEDFKIEKKVIFEKKEKSCAKKEKKEPRNPFTRNSKTLSQFEEFWQKYPKKEGKQNASIAFEKAIKQDKTGLLFDQIMSGLSAYKQAKQGTELKFIKHASTWLNGAHWNDEYDFNNNTNLSLNNETNIGSSQYSGPLQQPKVQFSREFHKHEAQRQEAEQYLRDVASGEINAGLWGNNKRAGNE